MDSIADMLTTLVNAQRVGHERVSLPQAKFKEALVRMLQKRGLVAAVRVQEGSVPKLIVTLAYEDGKPKLRVLKRLSKPGCRVYATRGSLPYAKGTGFLVVSTSQGLMDEREARAAGLGGELICEVS